MKQNIKFDAIVNLLEGFLEKEASPSVTQIANIGRDPYLILISTLLSLRTKDEVTLKASNRLFSFAKTPQDMIKIPILDIEKAIYPVGFYHRKAEQIHSVSQYLLDNHQGQVPGTLEELLAIKGVGRKTANLVLTEGFRIQRITVDTHVHRISNRLGIVCTKNATETEFALMKVLPKKHWIIFNEMLVRYGQMICNPISPKCSICVITKHCQRVGVTKSR